MEEKLRQKIKEIVEERGLSVFGMSDNQAQNRRLNRQINEGCSITLPTVFDILVKFPEISSEWLLRDEGSKYISDLPSTDHDDSDEVLELKAEITRLRAERDELARKLAISERRIDKLIDILHQEPEPRFSIVAEEQTYNHRNNIEL